MTIGFSVRNGDTHESIPAYEIIGTCAVISEKDQNSARALSRIQEIQVKRLSNPYHLGNFNHLMLVEVYGNIYPDSQIQDIIEKAFKALNLTSLPVLKSKNGHPVSFVLVDEQIAPCLDALGKVGQFVNLKEAIGSYLNIDLLRLEQEFKLKKDAVMASIPGMKELNDENNKLRADIHQIKQEVIHLKQYMNKLQNQQSGVAKYTVADTSKSEPSSTPTETMIVSDTSPVGFNQTKA